MTAGEWIAAYAAVLSTALAVVRVLEFRAARPQIAFVIVDSELHSERPGSTPLSFVAIHVRNRGPVPVPINTVGFLLKNGHGLLFNQIVELLPYDRLPSTVAPASSSTMGFYASKLSESIGDDVGQLAKVMCTDGAGRTYSRGLTGEERNTIRKAIQGSK